ncbi:DUF2332 family protein [Enterovirga aerilata]|uniref:DUF2332 domain-containing protein n=1 Tax=Enterovirga aerilata TaxID=2730920 RepID=A0A849I3E9_9HYPH|nr:DUF2332 domain-containing protein [Enterovirga sp. DB1703]
MTEGAADREGEVRAAFARQAEWCAALGSPFTSLLCGLLGRRLDQGTAIGRRVLGWPGRPDALHDSVPLRLCAALHGLVRAGSAPDLAALYPPNAVPAPERLWTALLQAMREAEAELLPWLDLPPQTNEVARSAVLTAGLAVISAEAGLPLSLHELGASAGLNMLPDRYDIRLGTRRYGDPASPVKLAPDWQGDDPPSAKLRLARRQGVDIRPIDIADERARSRLLAYVWPDQPDRLARLEAALALAAADPPRVAPGDAALWLEENLGGRAEPGIARVILHSIAFQYFPRETQERIVRHIETVGSAATANAPIGWLRYEVEGTTGSPSLRLRLWPGGRDRLLAHADPHGRWLRWVT